MKYRMDNFWCDFEEWCDDKGAMQKLLMGDLEDGGPQYDVAT